MESLLTKKDLMDCFDYLEEEKSPQYIGIVVRNEAYAVPEIIINERRAFNDKREYYCSAYKEDLTLKSTNTIKIIAWFVGGLEEIVDSFEEYLNDNFGVIE